ncbi:MAG TPA: cytochrome c3 family protein, partial [Candidatus Eisenbacteria bacterium]|nr:cytochrome c3 family protein [Candidatus Eisenbacteria bacterium]
NDVCFDCHNDPGIRSERTPGGEALFVDPKALQGSVHESASCLDCHADIDPEDLPHPAHLKKVRCGTCHDAAQADFAASIHGQALHRKAPYAPDCVDCHGSHRILGPLDAGSPTYKMQVPYLCGRCHREGAPVARMYEISEHNIIENYSESIHGEGLFKKGLVVTATCNNCHGSHLILAHTDPRSSISPRNIASTCMQCHARIEDVHVQIIKGQVWEKAPGAVPACTDCHLPHKVRKENVTLTISDRSCLKCHEEPGLRRTAGPDTSMVTVDPKVLSASIHRNIPCVKCHNDVDPDLSRPCATAGRVDCSDCHAKVAEEYTRSGHGEAAKRGVAEAPRCGTCHGAHDVRSHQDEASPTYRAQVPELCGQCHRSGGKASEVAELSQPAALTDYSNSVHGRGLTEKGLLPSAVCIDCHSSHEILKHTDERSSVFNKNIPATCGSCHRLIYRQYTKSVHYAASEANGKELPSCTRCHSSHTIQNVTQDAFMTEVTSQCGSCHNELAESYLETMHGKAYRLGYLQAAKCSDCHGAHQILSHNDANAPVAVSHIVETCKKCHEDANARFTGYLTHATHHDPKRYPALYYTYWTMTALLVSVFAFFGLHTLLWLPRSFRMYRERKRERKTTHDKYYIRRFAASQRLTHLFVIMSFLSLALTGMMLKFSAMPWAAFLARTLGGVKAAGMIHRTAAVITFGYFAFHLISLVRLKRKRRIAWRELALGPGSLMVNRRDLQEFLENIKWFLGRGPRPRYGRWTYWEKFDYLAVFWGVAVIGLSGLMLWFPETFTRVFPGWLINVATIVHSDEALLAVGFIFTIHFFNTHLRPEAFPMDTVIFTGLTPLDEYRKDRPREYEEMKQR